MNTENRKLWEACGQTNALYTQKAQECFSAASLLMLLMSAVLTALLFFFAEPILRFLVGLVESSAAKRKKAV